MNNVEIQAENEKQNFNIFEENNKRMKRLFIIAAAVTLCSCSKSKEGNLNVLKTENTTEKNQQDFEESNGYIASDGSRAKVVLKKKKKDYTISISANNTTFVLDYTSSTPDGEIFERNGIKAETKGDSLFISSDGKIIELAKVK